MAPGMREMIGAAAERVEAGMARFGHGRLYRNFTEETRPDPRIREASDPALGLAEAGDPRPPRGRAGPPWGRMWA
jgi:hypothetical protein